MNHIYSDEPWSFENSGRVEAGLVTENGASRKMVVRYNEQYTGSIETSCVGYGRFPVRVKINLMNARHFQPYEVWGMALTVSELICSENDLQRAREEIVLAMLACVWEVGSAAIENPEFEHSVDGNAEEWLRIKEIRKS